MHGIPEAQMSENVHGVSRTIGTGKKDVKYCQCGCGKIVKNKYVKYHYIPTNKIHGDHLTGLYALWRNIRYRCTCKTSKDYFWYGSRGIFVCKDWNNYFEFKNWAIRSGYKKGVTIERKNTNGNYEPENCIFTTVEKNNRNKTTGYWWFIYGKRFASAQSAAEFWGFTEQAIMYWCGLGRKAWPQPHCYRVRKYGNY
jgi:hypothetical protein